MVKGIAHMEGIVRPLAWDEFPGTVCVVFKAFRSPAGEKMALEQKLFMESVLPGAIMRKLKPEEMEVYRKPFAELGEGRRPTLALLAGMHERGRFLRPCRACDLPHLLAGQRPVGCLEFTTGRLADGNGCDRVPAQMRHSRGGRARFRARTAVNEFNQPRQRAKKIPLSCPP